MISTNPKNNIVTLALFIVLMFIWSSSLKAQQEIPDIIKDQILQGMNLVETAKVPGDIDKAINLFKEAIELAPEYPDAHYFLGKTLSLMQGNSGKAINELKKYLDLYPDAPDKEKVDTEIAQLEEVIKTKNKSYLTGISLIELPDGIYVRHVSPNFNAKHFAGMGKRVQLVFSGDKIEKINDVNIKGYSMQDMFNLIERDTNADTKISLKRANYKFDVHTYLKKDKIFSYDVRELGEEDLTTIIKEAKTPMVVFFMSDWCEACEKYNRHIINSSRDSKIFIIANIDESSYLSKEFSISQTPTIHIYKEGKLFDKIVGYDAELYNEKMEKLLQN